MMRYQKFPPVAPLLPFVECYYALEGRAARPITVQSPPNGYCAIVINYGDAYSASQHSTDVVNVPLAFVSGQFTSNYQLHFNGDIGMVGIVLKPSALHNIFGIRMSQLVNSRAPLSFLEAVDGDSLTTSIQTETSDESRVKNLEAFMLSFVKKGKANLSIIDEAIERIDACKGCITVEKLAADLKVSRRYLEKKFLEKVGVSPKFYSRLKRFGTLSNIIAHQKEIDWQQIVLEYGFHDQSHLVKEFLEFNQMNPTQYHAVHQEMTRFIMK